MAGPAKRAEMAAEAADAGPRAAVPVDLRRERRLVCVEYPGVVRDVAKMLPTLGGEEGVSRVRAGTLLDSGGGTESRDRGRGGGASLGNVVSLATEVGPAAVLARAQHPRDAAGRVSESPWALFHPVPGDESHPRHPRRERGQAAASQRVLSLLVLLLRVESKSCLPACSWGQRCMS